MVIENYNRLPELWEWAIENYNRLPELWKWL
jgi:hypothetical protein